MLQRHNLHPPKLQCHRSTPKLHPKHHQLSFQRPPKLHPPKQHQLSFQLQPSVLPPVLRRQRSPAVCRRLSKLLMLKLRMQK